MSDSVRPHRRQPTRLLRPWDSPGKTLEWVAISPPMYKSESEVLHSCSTLSNPMDCSLPGSSTHGIFQARVLEWAAIAFSGDYVYILKTTKFKKQKNKIHNYTFNSNPTCLSSFCPFYVCKYLLKQWEAWSWLVSVYTLICSIILLVFPIYSLSYCLLSPYHPPLHCPVSSVSSAITDG